MTASGTEPRSSARRLPSPRALTPMSPAARASSRASRACAEAICRCSAGCSWASLAVPNCHSIGELETLSKRTSAPSQRRGGDRSRRARRAVVAEQPCLFFACHHVSASTCEAKSAGAAGISARGTTASGSTRSGRWAGARRRETRSRGRGAQAPRPRAPTTNGTREADATEHRTEALMGRRGDDRYIASRKRFAEILGVVGGPGIGTSVCAGRRAASRSPSGLATRTSGRGCTGSPDRRRRSAAQVVVGRFAGFPNVAYAWLAMHDELARSTLGG